MRLLNRLIADAREFFVANRGLRRDLDLRRVPQKNAAIEEEQSFCHAKTAWATFREPITSGDELGD